jgi:N-formylglutamate amidohydrolase
MMNAQTKENQFEQNCINKFYPPAVIKRAEEWKNGIIFASAHSGSIYPDAFIERTDLAIKQLRRNEDAFITNLFSPAPDLGAPLIEANFPRCFVDVNRASNELPSFWQTDGKIISPRAEIGMGVVPTMLSETINIYSEPLSLTAAKIRIKDLYHPYHDALQGLIGEARSLFGKVLLIDCHSMPGFNSMGSRRSDIILGDRFGESCSPEIVMLVEKLFQGLGYSVSRNYPYAGGFVTKYYGKPYESANALQIEINRDLYLNPITLDKKPGFTALAKNISLIINSIIKEVTALNL